MCCLMWRFMRNRKLPDGINTIHRNSGGVSIEVLATMLLLLLLGICIFSLAITSTSAYERIYQEKSVSSSVRTALSFIEMKIRQNDIQGAVRIENNPINLEQSLVITEEYNSEFYETWIYRSGGKLREAFMPAGEPPADDLSFEIADLSGFSISMDRNTIRVSVMGNEQGKQVSLDSLISLRSD